MDEKKVLLDEWAAFEGDTVVVPVTTSSGKKPQIEVDKDKVVTMVEKYGALWMLDIVGGVAILDPLDVPSDFHME